MVFYYSYYTYLFILCNLKIYPVTFGPFLGGIANAYIKSSICDDFCANHGLLVRKNPNIHEWIKEFYPEYINSDYLDQDSKITMDIYRRENNKYWEEIKTNYLNSNPIIIV